MPSSSLIFLVLIGIWAAYLLQHWVSRREHLATARSVDRFSDAMRVLERRSPSPDFELSVSRPRSYAIGPERHSRPEVVVNSAHPARPDVPTTAAAVASGVAVRPTRVFRILAGVSARRVRGLSLLGTLLLILVTSLLAAVSVLPRWSALVAVAAVITDVAWLRRVAVSQRASGRTKAKVDRSTAGSAGQAARQPTYFDAKPEREFEPSDPSERTTEAAAPGAEAAEITESLEPLAALDPSSWAPVPVPPPTYTLKAKAAEPALAPEPMVVAAPGAAECWSLDGMVYDCDLDELVERRRATGT